MIRTRLLVGSILALVAGGVLIGDDYLAPGWFPFLFASLMALGVLAGRELVRLLPEPLRPSELLTISGILLCLAANWLPRITPSAPWIPDAGSDSHALAVRGWIIFILVAVLVTAFLLEIRNYSGKTGRAVPRIAATMLAVTYLGVLPCFFVQTRFITGYSFSTGVLLALVIFVPKGNDIAAFFTGTFLGRHKMTPLLSPKKTWEGFFGGMIGGIAVAVGFSYTAPIFANVTEAIIFGAVIGLAGILGDLAESLIKRDCQTKDASKSIPGFGGLLDVVDSVLFAAPIAYMWFIIV